MRGEAVGQVEMIEELEVVSLPFWVFFEAARL